MRVVHVSAWLSLALALAAGVSAHAAWAAPEARVPLMESGLGTYYVPVRIVGGDSEAYLLDTGAGYITITEPRLAALQSEQSGVHLLRRLPAMLADGREINVPIYLLPEITIGERCRLQNVEAAVLPGANRGLLGLSVLRKAAPFTMNLDPPELLLSHCQ